jgi:UDP-N-acetylmuramyl pentapeptide phosphotransferase/UDP-N-acetylglucosamine-1-phosphate transferase
MGADLSLSIAIAPLVAFTVTLALVRYLIHSSGVLRILDHPNERSLHGKAVPRTGGLGIMCGIFASWVFIPHALPWIIWTSVLLLTVLSFADDVFGLPVWARLILHGAVASWLSVSMLADTDGWMAAAVAALAITWMLNLYNFMDGSDGLAGGMTLIGFGCYALIAWSGGNQPLAMINFCIAAAAAAFLLFNFYPARIFMGDSGSIPLGFLAAVLGLVGWKNGNWPFWLPLVVFSPFIADASVTLIKRGLRGEKVWQAHREHYYQRMARDLLGHRNTALLGYGLMCASGASAMWAVKQDAFIQLSVCIGWVAVYAATMLVSDRWWIRHSSSS